MSSEKQRLEKMLEELEEKIAATELRMPAHSVQQPVMADLFALEEERDSVLQQIKNLQ